MKDKQTEEFLKALNEIEAMLRILLFKRHSFFEKGLAYYIEYKKQNNTRVEFLFGPPDWDIEIILYTSKEKFAFKDLLGIPTVTKWVNDNRYKQKSGRNLRDELLWFIKLLEFSLPMIE